MPRDYSTQPTRLIVRRLERLNETIAGIHGHASKPFCDEREEIINELILRAQGNSEYQRRQLLVAVSEFDKAA